MILALYEDKKKDRVKYAKIGNTLADTEYGTVSWSELDDLDIFGVEKIILDNKASKKLVKEVEKLVKEKNAALETVDATKALLTANWLNLGNNDLSDIDFPHIAFVDEPHKTCLFIVSSPTSMKCICEITDDHLAHLKKDIEKELDIDDLYDAASTGDESVHQFNFMMKQPMENPFDGLRHFFEHAKEKFANLKTEKTGKEEVDKELEKIAKADFAASFQDALIKHLLYRIFEAAGDTGISLITLGGDYSQNPRMQELAVRLADEVDFDVRFPEPDHHDNPAIALGARAHLDKYKKIF